MSNHRNKSVLYEINSFAENMYMLSALSNALGIILDTDPDGMVDRC